LIKKLVVLVLVFVKYIITALPSCGFIVPFTKPLLSFPVVNVLITLSLSLSLSSFYLSVERGHDEK
jgi:hypothetical protein